MKLADVVKLKWKCPVCGYINTIYDDGLGPTLEDLCGGCNDWFSIEDIEEYYTVKEG